MQCLCVWLQEGGGQCKTWKLNISYPNIMFSVYDVGLLGQLVLSYLQPIDACESLLVTDDWMQWYPRAYAKH